MGRQNLTSEAVGWKPTDKQLAVLNAAAEVGLLRSISTVAMEAGVSRQAIHGWLNDDPGFKQAWEDIPKTMIGNHMPGVFAALLRKCEMGDVPAIKLACEITGVYKPAVQKHEIKHEGKLELTVLKDEQLRGLEEALTALASRGRGLATADRDGEAPPLLGN